MNAEMTIVLLGIDGVMFGRALFGAPWLFDAVERDRATHAPSLHDLLMSRSSESRTADVGQNPPIGCARDINTV
jgi:tRNA-dihydrouridine synthase